MINVMPIVSVIIPCYNEEKTIHFLLKALSTQTYPIDQLEILIIDGYSTDKTRDKIKVFQNQEKKLSVRIIDNIAKKIPHALNIGINEAIGEIIIRLDAHSIPNQNYIELCVQDLEKGKGDNVGGVWDIKPGDDGWVSKGIAIAAAHPMGVGGAKYRYTNKSQYVDTVPFGALYKTKLVDLGGFDESLIANEDYDLNSRIISSGGKIWLNAKIRAQYFARSNFKLLVIQYIRYGFWKFKMLQKFPKTIKPRQAIPPIFVLGLLLGPLLWNAYPLLRLIYLIAVVLYGVVLISVSFRTVIKTRYLPNLISIPIAIAVMQISWGSAFLWSIIESLFRGIMVKKR